MGIFSFFSRSRKHPSNQSDVLKDFNRVMGFFLKNYSEREYLYKDVDANRKRLRSINKGERRLLRIIHKNINHLEQAASDNKFKHEVHKLLKPAISVVEMYLELEQSYLHGVVDEKRFKHHYDTYIDLKNNLPVGEAQRLLNKLSGVDISLRKKVSEYFRMHVIFSAVFVELFTLTLSSYHSVIQGAEFEHVSASDYILFTSIIIFLSMIKAPDRCMVFYDKLIHEHIIS